MIGLPEPLAATLVGDFVTGFAAGLVAIMAKGLLLPSSLLAMVKLLTPLLAPLLVATFLALALRSSGTTAIFRPGLSLLPGFDV